MKTLTLIALDAALRLVVTLAFVATVCGFAALAFAP